MRMVNRTLEVTSRPRSNFCAAIAFSVYIFTVYASLFKYACIATSMSSILGIGHEKYLVFGHRKFILKSYNILSEKKTTSQYIILLCTCSPKMVIIPAFQVGREHHFTVYSSSTFKALRS